ncbi:MAG: hypothetical protein HY049_10170 [Acidobacteria bacterium]|nr:hypothetical protein [Acidobacteriota bacterium]
MNRFVAGSTTIVAFGLIMAGAPAALAGSDACLAGARSMLVSCQAGAQSGFALARGKCLNLPVPRAVRDCMAAATDERKSAFGDCGEQLDARLDVCNRLGGGPYAPAIDPKDFGGPIDNPLLPMSPGTTYVYETRTAAGLERNVVEVTSNTRLILGVTCVEVHDTVSLNGELSEDTLDWFAEDRAGNVWYFGENSKELAGGLAVSLEGSWEAGVDGAFPGIVMRTASKIGDLYRQEFELGTAEDLAEVVGLAATATVPYGTFTGLLETHEFSPLEPDANEHKFYAPGIGFVLEIDLVSGDRTELVSVTP